ncbi:LPXTG cell wall anchor domain-containing protein, partial [Enterococcus gilvus]|uniref:LPXTG cell wall anchor domain-containing protein n=1 Tax=Enterococcus gilvus TaxID=160453 RepID=UPI003D6BAE95
KVNSLGNETSNSKKVDPNYSEYSYTRTKDKKVTSNAYSMYPQTNEHKGILGAILGVTMVSISGVLWFFKRK